VFAPFALPQLVKEWSLVRSHLPYMVVTAFLGITCFNTLIYIAGHTTTAMNLSLIAITFPVFIVLISRMLFNEKLTLKKFAGILLVMSGVIFLVTRGEISRLLRIELVAGDLLMLSAALIFAVFTILLKYKPGNISLHTFQFALFSIGLFFLLPFFIWEQAGSAGMILNQTTVGAILYVGIFASLLAFLSWNRAILSLGPSRAGMIYYTLPLFSGILAFLFIGEDIGLIHGASLVLIVSGIVMANHSS
jgi:drug/metabolite transporter (DMT)-like permease